MKIIDIKTAFFPQHPIHNLYIHDNYASALEIENCIKKAGEIFDLTIESSSLTSLPISIKHLNKLTTLRLAFPSLVSLPDDFFELIEGIERIFIDCPNLEKLPSSLFQNSILNRLELKTSAQKLPKKINLPAINYYRLESPLNQLSDNLFSPDLQYFKIKSDQLTEIPVTITNSQNIYTLDIQCPLQKPLPDLKKLENLKQLNLYGLKINAIEIEPKYPKNLQSLTINNAENFNYQPDISNLLNLTNLYHQNAPDFLNNLGKLSTLSHFNCFNVAGGILPGELKYCQQLQFLQITRSQLTEFPTSIFELKNLQTLEIIGGDIEALPMNWPKMPALTTISLRSNKMAVQDLSFTDNLANLKKLDLSGNILLNRYALQTKRRIDVRLDLTGLKFIGKRGGRKKGYGFSVISDFQDFAAALAKATLSQKDKNWFYDLVWNTRYVDELPELSFQKFLMALNINYKPLREHLERKLNMEVLFQHLFASDLFQNPVKFEPPANLKSGDKIYLAGQTNLDKSELADWAEEAGLEVCSRQTGAFDYLILGRNFEQNVANQKVGYQTITENALRNYLQDAAPRFLQAEEKLGENEMAKNLQELLNHLDAENVKIGLATMQGGGVPKEFMEPLLVMSKCDEDAEIRKDAKSLLDKYGPKNWQPLLQNRLEFHQPKLFTETHRQLERKLRILSENIPQDLFAFFVYLLQSQAKNHLVKTIIEKLLYEEADKMSFTEKFLEAGAKVFVNGITRLKKTEIKEKLESVSLKYCSKFSEEVTHVLIGNNPKFHDIDRSKISILTENYLQKYLTQLAPQYLEEAADTGGASMNKGLQQLLYSDDYSNAAVALEMMEGGGVPTVFLSEVLVLAKSAPDAKIRAKARKLLELYAPNDWLPLVKSKLFWKGIDAETKDSAIKKRLDKLAKETSHELAAVLSFAIWKRHQKGLRFLLAKSNKRDQFKQAISLLMDDTHLNYSKGMGYKSLRDFHFQHVPFPGWQVKATFPKYIKTLAPIESIDFHNCKFKEIPHAVFGLTKLKKLDLSFNNLPELPAEIAVLENLEELNLRCNCFELFPENLHFLKNLKKVDLRNNRSDYNFKKLAIPEGFEVLMPDCKILV